MKRKKIFRIIGVLFLSGIVAAGLFYKFVINKPHQDYEKAKPDYIISAEDLFDGYRSDRKAAETKFNGKIVLLTGRLDKIENNGSLVTGVFVFNQGMFGDEGIRCTMLPKYSEILSRLDSGSEVKLKGYLTGYNETDVILENCSIIR